MTLKSVSETNFYRIENASTDWEEGSVVEVGNQENPFTINWKNEESKISRPDLGREKWVNQELESVYRAVISPKNSKKRLEELVALPSALAKILKALNDSILASRELAFELVRKSDFSELPSRMECMFLIPDEIACIKYWWNELKTQGGGNRKLYRVSLAGRFHKASAGQLVPLRTCAINEWHDLARRYWEPQNACTPDTEVLACGTVTFLERLDPMLYGCVE